MRFRPHISEQGLNTNGPKEYAKRKTERIKFVWIPLGMWRSWLMLSRAGADMDEDIGATKAKSDITTVT
jgi:hypothetical protein